MNRALVLAALLLLSTPAWATDGDWVETTRGSVQGQGAATIIDTFKLCDGATGGASKTCTVFDLSAAHTTTTGAALPGGPRPSLPDAITFSFALATGCSGATTVMPMGSDESDLDPRYDLTTTLLAKPASSEGNQLHLPSGYVSNRYITADIQTGTDCSDVEVWMKLHYFVK